MWCCRFVSGQNGQYSLVMKRCDHLPLSDANPGKIREALDVLRAMRGAAPDVAADQGQRFFETGRFNKMVSAAGEARSPRILRAKTRVGAVRVQMLRYQVVRQLDSFMSNRSNDFKETVLRSTVDDAVRHQLLTINRAGAWFSREPINMASGPHKGEKQGLKPNHSRRYRARVAAFRGFLKTEIGRVLNRVIMQKRPAHVVLEKLDFRAPGLSLWLNRILARSGRVVIRSKMKDFEERYGITFSEVNPAYSSQTCSECGFVSKANRKTQSDFSYRSCGHEIHADVNAARNLDSGRSAFDRRARLTKAQSLEATIRRHLERITTRDRVIPAAVLSSPYYRASKAAAEVLLTKKLQPPDPQDLGADVSAG
ncbi:hypothetical protein HYN69_17030 [Gemmobacter aquarius]|uniref:Cas12f1-like TNB domain-containing protein n=2 Tax=Paragemmobacter aquarius TaxID=2169400 RepID=A0A2S0UQ82_9RHOB|nr:hypothetical protein HYN69_17030 [Gemmobacter aquarius]